MEGGIKSMNNVKCKKCGQIKAKTEFYKGHSGVCKICRYVPRHSVKLSVLIKDNNNLLEFTGVSDYTFEDRFLRIEDSKDIHYIKIDSIFRITIKKQSDQKNTDKGIKFSIEPVML